MKFTVQGSDIPKYNGTYTLISGKSDDRVFANGMGGYCTRLVRDNSQEQYWIITSSPVRTCLPPQDAYQGYPSTTDPWQASEWVDVIFENIVRITLIKEKRNVF